MEDERRREEVLLGGKAECSAGRQLSPGRKKHSKRSEVPNLTYVNAVGLFEREEDCSNQAISSVVSFDFLEPFSCVESGTERETENEERSLSRRRARVGNG